MTRAQAAVGGCKTVSTLSVRWIRRFNRALPRSVAPRPVPVHPCWFDIIAHCFYFAAQSILRLMAAIDTFNQHDLRCNDNEMRFHYMERGLRMACARHISKFNTYKSTS